MLLVVAKNKAEFRRCIDFMKAEASRNPAMLADMVAAKGAQYVALIPDPRPTVEFLTRCWEVK